jgi:hypothetical protein
MKYILIFIAGILISSIAHSQNCNIGNEDTLNFNMTSGAFTKNVLLGVQFTLNTQGVLNSINLIGKNTGAQVRMAVYDDNNGVPNNLIASTGTTIVGNGIISLPVISTQLFPGDYWVMAIYDSTAVHTYEDSTAVGNVLYYNPLNFGSSIPSNASNFLSYSGDDFTYFLDITCGTVGVDNLELKNHISIYPNPSSDFIHISNIKEENYVLEIFDFSGNKVKTIEITSGEAEISIGNLSKGIYLVVINNRLLQNIVIQ